jgi:hypothetical protein
MQRDRCDDLSIRRTVGLEEWHLRRAHMARGMIGLAVVVILTAMLSSPAGAQQEAQLGQFCWTLNPFVDTIRLSITQGSSPAAIFELHGRWLANAAAGQQAAGGAGPANYQLLGAGTATDSTTLPNSFEAGFQAVHNTTFFGNNRGCNLYTVIDNMTLNGSWSLQCGPFTNQGNLTHVTPCPAQF